MRLISIEVENYRTLEKLNLSFLPTYNAICGKNNSGKSNILKAVRLLFGKTGERFFFEEDLDISYKSDLCIWKKDCDTNEPIKITGKIKVFRDADPGIVSFIESLDSEKTKVEKQKNEIDITISLIATNENRDVTPYSTTIDNQIIDDEAVSQSIYEKFRNCIVFHNSTRTRNIYFSNRRTLHGMFSKVSKEQKAKLDDRRNALKKEMQRVFNSYAIELQAMLGKLGDKLEVKLNTHELDFEEFPYGISLGYKDFNIPLDDWGSGTRNQTLIIKNMFEAKNSSQSPVLSQRITPIVLIEEPESFLHPLAQAQFSETLQSLSEEWGIQVLTTTHSPYILSHKDSKANILLERRKNIRSKTFGPTEIVKVSDKDWRKPFEHTLGLYGNEFEIFKDAFFSQAPLMLMVEGVTDKKYLELCQDKKHGKNSLVKECEIFSYDGIGNVSNSVILLKFFKEKFKKVIFTCDLDAQKEVEHRLISLGFKKDETYYFIGRDEPGKRAIEGLLPEYIRHSVLSENTALVEESRSNIKEEREQANQKLKDRMYEKFHQTATIENGDFIEFYKLCNKLNRSFVK